MYHSFLPGLAMETGPKRKKGSGAAPEAKKTKSTPLVCSACKVRSNQVEWAAVRGEFKEPVGDKCYQCGLLHGRAFQYLDWPAFVKLQDSQDAFVLTR